MKKIYLILYTLLLSGILQAQDIDQMRAIQLVTKNIAESGLTYESLTNSMVTNAYVNKTSGTELVYLQQLHKGLPVFNQIQVMAFKNGKIVSSTGNRVWEIERLSGHASEQPSVTPEKAIATALAEKKLTLTSPLQSRTLVAGRKYDYGKPGGFIENITAELMWVPDEEGTSVKLAWQVYLVPKTSSDYWLIRVDAKENRVIGENNLTVYCQIHKKQELNIGGLQHSYGNANADANEKPYDFGKNGTVNNRKIDLLQISANSPSIINSASYRVIPFPAESPKHPGGSPSLVTDPWNNAPGNATSLKWHSNGTTDYTITRGNNVWAKEDLAASNSTAGQPATSTSPSDPLSFDFVPNFNAPPTQTSPVPNQQFNITNLFYWNNIMHDVMYLYGFDEVSGNFQANNQGRGGAGNDWVNADAQDGNFITPNQNNANFSTPADGGSGRMQMYLWNPTPGFTVNAPSVIAGLYTSLESNFSTNNLLTNLGPRTGDVVYYNDNAATTHEGCVTPSNAGALNGKIALIDRGNCNFTVKVKNAQDAGAIAVIMVNNVAGSPIVMGGTDNTITIPAVMISDVDGLLLKNQLNNGLNVTLAPGQNMDGDVDNGIISHEFSHGTSNRLTGGPAQSTCVSNAEQMGEGWSDYYSLMFTQDWANSNVNTGFTNPRGIGTYAIGQSPSGSGIRTQKYCTDFTVNNLVFAASIPAQQHDRGEIWCATLWDMTWNIIKQTNTIAPSIYQSNLTAGNVIAMKLVTEAMKLQPCNPGFIDGRNAILKADSILYNGQYNCAIREAFRRRGMGLNASQGSASSVNDQIADFTPYISLKKNENVQQVPEGQNITFTTVVNSCSPLSGYILRDTLPSNVTYVSGGTYDAVNRVVSFTVNLPDGGIQSYAFTVQANPGSYFAPQTLLVEQVTTSTIPASWTASSSTGSAWIVSNVQSTSSPNSFFSPNAAVASDQKLETTNAIAMGTGTSSISFSHRYITQSGFDGGVVEISTDNGTTWNDLGQKIVAGYYTGTLATGSANPIAGRSAWTGSVNSFIRSSVNLTSYAGQNAKFRFRFGSNSSTALTGWYVDDIEIKREAVVNMRSSLFNSSGTRVGYYDTVALIIQTPSCTNVAITSQPANASACTGSNASFSVSSDGTTPNYQWQVSSDGGNTWNNISGATGASLSLSNVTLAMNNNRYRVLISNSCPSNSTSAAAILSVADPANISAQPSDQTVCEGENASFTVGATGSSNAYQWQVSTDGGNTWNNISGATSPTYTISNATTAVNNNRYRVVISSCGPNALNSTAVLLTVNGTAAITAQPANTSACTGGDASISVTASGSAVSYQWQVSNNGGATYTNISGANSATLTLTGITAGMNNNLYQVIISNQCNPGSTSTAALLTVSNPATINAQPAGTTVCEGNNASFTVNASGTSISYQWQVSTDGGTSWTNISGATSATLDLTAVTASMNGNRYRAVLVSCSPAGLNSDAAILTVNAAAAINTQPANANACTGTDATFSVSAAGTALNYQWQISTDGGVTFTDISGATNSTYTVTGVNTGMTGQLYHVIISNLCTPGVTSANATLTVSNNASIVSQPVNSTVCEGSNSSFNAGATGTGYQWQVSTDGGATWTDISGANSPTLNLNAVTASMNGNQYRLVASGCSATPATSNAAVLTVNSAASIGTQPADASTCEGNNASFSVTAAGTSPAYQWEISTDGGLTYTAITGANGATLSLPAVTLSMNNNRYRVIISNSCTSSLISNAATLTVTSQAAISTQPSAASGCPGSSASFSVSATGPGLSYQWQVSTDGGTTWSDISGATSAAYSISSLTPSLNNNRYRVSISSSCSANASISNDALLTVLPGAQVLQQPADVAGCVGSSATFTVNVNGSGFNYQWQVSTDGGNTFNNISGETNSSLTLTNISSTLNNNRYRVVMNASPCGATSDAAVLTVSPSPVVTITASPYTRLYPGQSTTLTASSNPPGANYTWFRNGVAVPGASGNTLQVGFNERGLYTASDLNGCANLSNALLIGDSASNMVFIYPNPNNGQFQVQYFNGTNVTQNLVITLYDEKGARVYQKPYAISNIFQRMEVDIRRLAKGTYMLSLTDPQGNRLGSGKVIKY